MSEASTPSSIPDPMPACTVEIDIVIESPRWDGSPATAESWIRQVVDKAVPAEHSGRELAIVFTDDTAVRALNARFRGYDKPTNVLSFPPPSFAVTGPGEAAPLGDVVIAFETTQAEAAAQGKEFFHHVTHLLVHGVLHLLGYDHLADAEAELMEMRERAVLGELGIPDPYQEHGAAGAGAAQAPDTLVPARVAESALADDDASAGRPAARNGA